MEKVNFHPRGSGKSFITPGDKFNIRHDNHGSGDGVWSGPYVADKVKRNGVVCYTDHGDKCQVYLYRCVKVEDEG